MNSTIISAIEGAHGALAESEKQFRATDSPGHAKLCHVHQLALADALVEASKEAMLVQPPQLHGAPTTPGHYWLVKDGVSTLHCVYNGRLKMAGQLVVVTRGISHTRSSVEESPVTALEGVWFGPLKPPVAPAKQARDGVLV